MATGSSDNELQVFRDFLGRLCDHAPAQLTPEESVEHFRAYQEEVKRFVAESETSLRQFEDGQARPLQDQQFWERIRQRLAERS